MRRWAAKLAGITPAEWLDFARAQLALVGAQVTVWWRPPGTLVRPSVSEAPPPTPEPLAPPIQALAVALRRAAKINPLRPQCLVRAIALARLLSARGYDGARVRVGVRREGDRLVAHAWVAYRGVVVGEPARVAATFVEMGAVEVHL